MREKIDLLITDYSSIYIDALQYSCEIAFFLFDKAHYQAECRNEYPYVAKLPKAGIDLITFKDLQDYLNDFAGVSELKLVQIDEKFYRPAEVDLLLGDSTKAREELGWKPKTSFKELVDKMVRHDILEHGQV